MFEVVTGGMSLRRCVEILGTVGRIPGFLYSKLFLFLFMYFYSIIAQVVADGLVATVVTKPELRVGFLELVAITQTERERRQSEKQPQRVRTFRIASFPWQTYRFHLRGW